MPGEEQQVEQGAGFFRSILDIYLARVPHDAEGWARLASSLLDVALIFLVAWALVRLACWISSVAISGAALVRGPVFERRARTVQSLVLSFLRYALFFIAAGAALTRLGLNWRPLFAAAGVVGLAVAFGSQGLVQDVVTGLSLLFEGQLAAGDYVEVAGKAGRVEGMTLRVVRIRDASGCLHTIPNRMVSVVSNYTAGYVRNIVDVFVRPDADARRATGAASAACDRCADLPVFVGRPRVKGLRHRGTPDAHVRVEVLAVPGQEAAAVAELTAALKAALAEAGVVAPDGRTRSLRESDLFTPPPAPATRRRGGLFRRKTPEPPSDG